MRASAASLRRLLGTLAPHMDDIESRFDAPSWAPRTYSARGLDFERLIEQKARRELSVTVCLPALNEEATVGPICEAISRDLIEPGLVDELVVVVDASSTDRTCEVARSAGATVHRSDELVPEVPLGTGGKGDVLWRSLAAASGDAIVWVDADIRRFHPGLVAGLLLPLLADPDIKFVKGFYRRDETGSVEHSGGGRVTELVARPLLCLFYPELAGLIQPLAGEMSGLLESLKDLPFFTGYGVELGLLIDVAKTFGVDAMAQVDLHRRQHRSRDLLSLGRASHQILEVVLKRLEDSGRIKLDDELPLSLIQFQANSDDHAPMVTYNPIEERPPMRSVLGGAGRTSSSSLSP